MRQRVGMSIATAVGVVAFLTPIFISLQMTWSESIASEKALGLSYAREALRRSEETAHQFGSAIRRLNQDRLPRCSPEEIDLMRQIDVGSSYIQMVGRISGDVLECTSLGTTQPIAVGKPTLVTENGVDERMGINLGSPQTDRLDLVSLDGVAVLVDTSGLIDEQTQGTDVGLAILVPSSQSRERLVQSGDVFHPSWFRPVARGSAVSFIDGAYLVSQVRSKNMDLAALSVMPQHYAYRLVGHFAMIFVPMGLLCGCGLSWAVIYLSRLRSSPAALLRSAARHHDFFVEYQPIVEFATGRCIGAEALVRWQRGNAVMSPASFIVLAEESGVIRQITECVTEAVARDLPRLLQFDPEFRVSINLSAADLRRMETLDLLNRLVLRSNASPRNILVEATEHSFLQIEQIQNVIREIRTAGFSVAIDDFGTGYSSLACLQNLEIDILKIDKLFVDAIGIDAPASRVVSHIIDMGESLQLGLVAEGVETTGQAEFLRGRGVAYAQGWLYGKPMSIDAICLHLRTTAQVQALSRTPSNRRGPSARKETSSAQGLKEQPRYVAAPVSPR